MRCKVCAMRHEPIDVQVDAARRRLGYMPVELRKARVAEKFWPAGQRWCAGCQSFVQLIDCTGSRCKACNSAATHTARIEKVYGLDRAGYDALLEVQGGRCAICRGRPTTKRLAVDHDHKTGEVRGLLCSRCNHDLMGAAWDSLAVANALVAYINTPPALGSWRDPAAPPLPPPRADLAGPGEPWGKSAPNVSTERTAPTGPMLIGSSQDEHGRYRLYIDAGDMRPPF